MSDTSAQGAGTGAGEVLLDVQDLTKSFDGLRAVDHASLQVKRGTITGLIGPNGAGKTSLFNLITGAITPDSGRVTFRGHDITGLPSHRIFEHKLCRTFQIPREHMLADVVVSASTDPEAFGRIAAEAQAMGRPLVASAHGGVPEQVIDGETAFLVPPGDDAALAEGVARALALDAEQRAAMKRVHFPPLLPAENADYLGIRGVPDRTRKTRDRSPE